jgi:outer membrane protein TolC
VNPKDKDAHWFADESLMMNSPSACTRASLATCVLAIATMLPVLSAPPGQAQETSALSKAVGQNVQTLSLKECLTIAMEKNHSRPASRFAVVIAEAQHRQALAAYWPQLTAKAGVERMEHAPEFAYPATAMYIPSETITTPASQAIVTIPANSFGPGAPPVNVQLPVAVPSQSITTPAQLFPVPQQNVKLMDPTTTSVEGDLKWLLWDGGMRRGYSEQALGAEDVARSDVHRTDLELSDSVTRLYYGAVLARQLHEVGSDTLERMETTLRLTESLYENGSGSVTKADYLDNKVVVEVIRSMVATLDANEASAEAALAYTMGLSWNASVAPADTEIPYNASQVKLDDLVANAYEFNPDWEKLAGGLRALEGERKTAESGHYPKLGLTGSLHRYWNSYDGGLSNSSNLQGWTVGAGVEIPVFDGFLTSGEVAEAQAKINQLKEQRMVLKEGIGLQLRRLFVELNASEKSYTAMHDAMTAAVSDEDVTTRGYAAGLLTTEKVIRAQMQSALVASAYYVAVYDHRALQSQIDMTVGQQVQEAIGATH